jgi:hypothetical protein
MIRTDGCGLAAGAHAAVRDQRCGRHMQRISKTASRRQGVQRLSLTIVSAQASRRGPGWWLIDERYGIAIASAARPKMAGGDGAGNSYGSNTWTGTASGAYTALGVAANGVRATRQRAQLPVTRSYARPPVTS